MENTSCKLHLYLHSGIPVLTLEGEWNEGIQQQLAEAINYLLLTAHFEVVINLAKAHRLPLLDLAWWHAFETLGERLAAHYGRLEVVGNREHVRIASALRRQRLQWALTEEEAICHLRGRSQCGQSVVVRAHLMTPDNERGLQPV
ncbi:anti-anti-sigma factor [Chthonomonas calidirosea]|uniref:Putative anti-anti-sigma factor n=1 Tax=Chthonomonas calidirosea (strain DSM 23976 / ICMP 18418 / T49) TaxID=1303518 RepID=S0EW65_CHTCT|nr:anti-anti-sigma factor [Chthonomonas calidirosea]CCW36056.1 putative anti-anti-sigma factor [Chthonomonas calidirosea T49]CEK17419.1 hypothetical protein CP488_01845 [Chthonomonas calidirosea]CEK18464.1 hypothetical protein CTKA_01846 [Chthonomonas calidirosea]